MYNKKELLKLILTCTGSLCLALGSSVAGATPQHYRITNLNISGGYAADINESGQITGHFFVYDNSGYGAESAFVWKAGSGIQRIVNDAHFTPSAINDHGQVVGKQLVQGATRLEYHAVLWDENNGMQDLGFIGYRWDDSSVTGINNSGQVVGIFSPNILSVNNNRSAFLWEAGIGMQDLGTLGGSWSEAHSINNAGQIVGMSQTDKLNEWNQVKPHAFLWEANKGMIDIPFDFTNMYFVGNSVLNNNNGQVLAKKSSHRYLWQENSDVQDLGDLGRYLNDFNDVGQIVGSTYTGDQGSTYATIWENGITYDLNSLINPNSGWVLDNAVAINNQGQIAGNGHYGNISQSFFLNPVPEPASILLLVSGLVGILGVKPHKN